MYTIKKLATAYSRKHPDNPIVLDEENSQFNHYQVFWGHKHINAGTYFTFTSVEDFKDWLIDVLLMDSHSEL